MPATLTASKYDKLISDLSSILEKGKQTAISAVNQIRLETYWTMGKRLAEAHELADPNQEDSLMSRLSEDLRSHSGIWNSLAFRRRLQ